MSNGEEVHVLDETEEEKDLVVFVFNNLEWKKQCRIAKANMVLGQIKT